MRHTNKFVTENFATLCNPQGMRCQGSTAPMATKGNRRQPQRRESRNQRVYLIKKLFSAAAANTHTHTQQENSTESLILHMPRLTEEREREREGRSCHVYLKAKAGNEICKSTSFNFAFSQNANSKWQIFLLRGINAAAAAAAVAAPAEAARLWLGVCPKWRGLLLACPARFFVVAFVVSAARHTLLQVFCNNAVLVLVHIAIVVGALPPKRQSTFPLAVSGFRYCFHAAIAACLSVRCIANEYGQVRLVSQA